MLRSALLSLAVLGWLGFGATTAQAKEPSASVKTAVLHTGGATAEARVSEVRWGRGSAYYAPYGYRAYRPYGYVYGYSQPYTSFYSPYYYTPYQSYYTPYRSYYTPYRSYYPGTYYYGPRFGFSFGW